MSIRRIKRSVPFSGNDVKCEFSFDLGRIKKNKNQFWKTHVRQLLKEHETFFTINSKTEKKNNDF